MNASVTPFQAVSLALAGYTFWVLADTGLKIIGAASLPAYEVVAVVGAVQVALLLAGNFCRQLRQPAAPGLWPRDPVRQMLRSCLDLANYFCVVVALRHVPLALFYILVFLAPIVTALLAALLLHERLGLKRALAILTGFAGVVIAVDPFSARRPGDWIGYLACLVCVGCFSASMVWSRKMTQTESPESMTFFSGLVLAVTGSLALLRHAERVTPEQVAVMGACGLFCVVGSLCFFVALKHTSAANVSQFHYSQLLTGALLAFLIWRERITMAMLTGACLIVLAGAYTAATTYGSSSTSTPPGLPTSGD